MIKIITDSTSYLDREEVDKLNIGVVALSVSLEDLDEKEYFQGEYDDFYKRFINSDEFPRTSQPSTGDFIKEFEKAFEEGQNEIICILFSSRLSGTYENCKLAREYFPDKKIHIIDSLLSGPGLAYLVRKAIKLKRKGWKAKDIVDYLEEKKKKIYIYLSVEDLEYLRRGGRLSKIGALVGNLLSVNPLLTFENGYIVALDRLRGKKKLRNKMIGKISEDVEKVYLSYMHYKDIALEYKEEILKSKPGLDIEISELGPVVGAHTGPGGIALIEIRK